MINVPISKEVMHSIKKLVEYNYKDEKRSYDECDEAFYAESHIFNDIEAISNWLLEVGAHGICNNCGTALDAHGRCGASGND